MFLMLLLLLDKNGKIGYFRFLKPLFSGDILKVELKSFLEYFFEILRHFWARTAHTLTLYNACAKKQEWVYSNNHKETISL